MSAWSSYRPLRQIETEESSPATCGWLLVICFAVQALLVNAFVTPYDEGLILYGGAMLANGAVPYRDFWSLYGPASYYVLGGIFHLFGETVANARLYDAGCRSLIVMFAYLIVRTFTSMRYAFLVALSVLLLLIALQQYEFPVYPATACGLFAVWCLTRSIRLPKKSCFFAGIAAGLAVTFRTDLGVYIFIACLYAAIASRDAGSVISKKAYASACYLFLGAGLIVIPVLLYLLIVVPSADLYEDFVHIAFKVYGPNRSLQFPRIEDLIRQASSGRSLHSLQQLVIYVPFIIAATAVTMVVRDRLFSRKEPGVLVPSTLIGSETLVILLALFILKGLIRVSFVHMGPALIIALIVGSVVVWRMRSLFVRVAVAVIALVCISRLNGLPDRIAERRAFVTNALMQPHLVTQVLNDLARCTHLGNVRLGCFRMDADRMAVLSYLDEHVEAGSFVFVGAGRHDKLFVNNVELYFFSGTRAPTKWFDLHPGVQTERSIQEEMIASFVRFPPRLAVLNSEWDNVREPNQSANSGGVLLLDRFLSQNFVEVMKVGTFTVLKPVRNDPVTVSDGG